MPIDTLASPFQYPIATCKTSNNAGSLLLIQNTVKCSATPYKYTITVSSAIASGATTAELTLTSATLDGAVVPAGDIPSVTIRAGSRLYTSPTAYISLVQDATLTSVSSTVDIDPALAAVAANATAETYALIGLRSVKDLPISMEAQTSDTSTLADGLQVTQNVTGLNLNSAISFFTSPEEVYVQSGILQRSALNTNNIYALIAKTSGNLAFGTAKVLGLTYSGAIREDEMASTTLNFQSWAVATSTSDPRVNSAVQLTALNSLYRLAGLPLIV